MPLSDSSQTYTRAVRPEPSPAVLRLTFAAGISEVSRFSCMKFLGVPWGLRLRRTDQRFTLSPLFILPAAACQVPIGGVGGLFSWSLFAEAWLLRNSIFQKSEKISGIENV